MHECNIASSPYYHQMSCLIEEKTNLLSLFSVLYIFSAIYLILTSFKVLICGQENWEKSILFFQDQTRIGIIKNQKGGGDETPLLNEESHSKTLERLMILQVHNTTD